MSTTSTLQSLIGGRWLGKEAAQPLHSAIDGALIYHTHAERIDFAEALAYARGTGVPALMALNFQTRAARLKALALYLMEHKEELYAISRLSGATRPDSWIDIEGGIGTLFAYASMGSRELPSSNVLHEGPALALGKNGGFAGTHILVPRGGVAVHINAFNFPICSKNSRPASWPPCPASPSRPPPPATWPKPWCAWPTPPACCRPAPCNW
jgi:oxepin-CoA hydrolase / 3-oxo-5,6-dehydrosuberyl-CoA semialdehyde dehydrogenase